MANTCEEKKREDGAPLLLRMCDGGKESTRMMIRNVCVLSFFFFTRSAFPTPFLSTPQRMHYSPFFVFFFFFLVLLVIPDSVALPLYVPHASSLVLNARVCFAASLVCCDSIKEREKETGVERTARESKKKKRKGNRSSFCAATREEYTEEKTENTGGGREKQIGRSRVLQRRRRSCRMGTGERKREKKGQRILEIFFKKRK